MFGNPYKSRLPTPEEALAGRPQRIPVAPRHFVLGTPSTFTINYSQAPTIFESGSSHVFQVTFTTLDGEVVPDAVTFTAPEWTAIPPALGTAVGTVSDPGMRWRTHQLATARANEQITHL